MPKQGQTFIYQSSDLKTEADVLHMYMNIFVYLYKIPIHKLKYIIYFI